MCAKVPCHVLHGRFLFSSLFVSFIQKLELSKQTRALGQAQVVRGRGVPEAVVLPPAPALALRPCQRCHKGREWAGGLTWMVLISSAPT